jgi:hypothetical protein
MTWLETGEVSVTKRPMLMARTMEAKQEAAEAEGGCFGSRLHACEQVRHVQKTDGGEQNQRRAEEHKNTGKPGHHSSLSFWA